MRGSGGRCSAKMTALPKAAIAAAESVSTAFGPFRFVLDETLLDR